MIELVVTDLDGTLWDADLRVAQSTLQAIDELGRRGIPLLAATARRFTSSRRTLAKSGLVLPGVFVNGALGRDTSSGVTFQRTAFAPEQAVALVGVFRGAGVEPCLNVDHPQLDMVSTTATAAASGYLHDVRNELTYVGTEELTDIAATVPVLGMSTIGQADSLLRPLYEQLTHWQNVRTYYIHERIWNAEMSLNVAPVGVNKWSGVQAYCQYAAIDSSHVLAVGDGANDMELLTNAVVGCAMDHATEELKAAANVVLSPAKGWAAILEQL